MKLEYKFGPNIVIPCIIVWLLSLAWTIFFFSFYLFSIVMLLKETSASNLAPSSYKRLAQIYVIYFGFNNEPKLLTCASRFDCLDL